MKTNINVNLRINNLFRVETFLYSPHDCAASEAVPHAIRHILISNTFPSDYRPYQFHQ